MKKLCVIIGTAALLAACGEEPVRTAADIGSGWEDLDGSIVNYEYPDFSGFYLHFRNGALQWKGFAGLFKGVVSEVDLVASKVNDRVYFMSWPTPNGGGDNVIMNFDTMKVHAHLGPGDGFQLFSGTMKVYDQIMPDGTRKEAVFDAICFASEGC